MIHNPDERARELARQYVKAVPDVGGGRGDTFNAFVAGYVTAQAMAGAGDEGRADMITRSWQSRRDVWRALAGRLPWHVAQRVIKAGEGDGPADWTGDDDGAPTRREARDALDFIARQERADRVARDLGLAR